eukprot:318363_1
MVYNHNNFSTNITNMKSQRYAQYQQSLYFVVENNDRKDVLVDLNLHSLSIQFIAMPEIEVDGKDKYCLVTDGLQIYLVAEPYLLTYKIQTNKWNIGIIEHLYTTTCAITNDYQYIYIFTAPKPRTDSAVIKYETKTGIYTFLENPNLCFSRYDAARAITGKDGKMYLHGCYVASWRTLIFNPTLEQFETQTIDIDTPTHTYYHRYSQLAVFDDNILLLRHTTEEGATSLYFGVTDLISINLTNTERKLLLNNNEYIWPS